MASSKRPLAPRDSTIYSGDNAALLPRLRDGFFQLIYADPPFNTGTVQTRRTLATVADARGDRTGFNGRRYRTTQLSASSFSARGTERIVQRSDNDHGDPDATGRATRPEPGGCGARRVHRAASGSGDGTRSGHSSHLPPAPRQLPPIPGRAASNPSACISAASGSQSVSRARGRGRGEAIPAESR